MNTQTPTNAPAAAAVPPVTPPVAPVVPAAAPATPSNNEPTATPPANPPVVPAAPAAPAADPFANSNWPESAKAKVRDLSRKNREKSQIIEQQQAYIGTVDAKMNALKHPSRDQFPEGEIGDHAFVNAISSHNADKSALAVEKLRVNGAIETVKTEVQATQAELQLERVNAARAEFPDLDTVVQNSRLPVGPHLGYALNVADNGPQMMYILNKLPPQETQRLNGMAWTEILQELPQLEARYRTSQNKPAAAAVPPAIPPAPPIEPIGGDSGFPSTGNGYKEWELERNKKADLRF